ncbi:MAG: nucleotide excision repair endonuclease [Limisphaerales bacterium]
MEIGQLRLIPAPQPLVARLGEGFFRAVPRVPGVYRMYDEAGVLIYVGKAGDLRSRLDSYRRTSGQSRKTIRLIHAVRRVEWEACSSETAARLLENELIRSLRPRFNRVGTWPASARFVCFETTSSGLRLFLSPGGTSAQASALTSTSTPPLTPFPIPTPTLEGLERRYGPFRGGPGRALLAMARLLSFAWLGRGEVAALPRAWVVGETIRDLVLDHPSASEWVPDLSRYLAAEDDGLVGRLVDVTPQPEGRFDQAFMAREFEVLQGFYRRGPLRNRRLRARFGGDATVVTPEMLDDWAIEAGVEEEAPRFRPDEDGDIGLDLGAGLPDEATPRNPRPC